MAFRRLSNYRLLVCLAFCLMSPSLARAQIHGGIEIGAKGIRAIAVDFTAKDGEPKILSLENKNTTLVADLAAKKQFSSEALKATADIVGGLAKKIRDDFQVPEAQLYVVGSSGLFAALEGNETLIKTNKEQLIQAIREATGITMDFVSVVREAELTITSVIPVKLRPQAVLMDIGSGNTKGGAELSGKLITFGIPFGTVTFADRVKKEADKDNFAITAARLRKEILTPKLRDSLQGKSELLKRNRVYLAGGTVWALATFMKPADRGNAVPIVPGDIDAFLTFLAANPKELPNTSLSAISDAETKKAATHDMDRVRKTFSRDQLIAGVEVLKALAEAFQLDGQDKQIVFARNAYIGWILGYTIEKGMASK